VFGLGHDGPLGDPGFGAGLHAKGIRGAPGMFEMTWAPDGRAVSQYGDPVVEGEAHMIWRRVATHAVLGRP
jgi:hypothetical protein